MDRRRFLGLLTAGTGLGAIALLEACNPAPATPVATSAPAKPTAAPTSAQVPRPAATGAAGGRVTLPTRIPLQGISPDLPPSTDGLIDAAFVNYPANPPRTVTETPGSGGTVNVMTWTTSAAPTPMDSNQLWQAVNKELGVDLNISVQAQADYATVKLPTLIAGGELPDILYIAPNSVIPQFPTFLKAKCADLTPYLSGDAVKDYPNLANFPSLAWKQVIYNNAIYGVPVPYPLYLWVHWVHQNLLDADGLDRPKNADDYKKLAQHLTRPDENLYGMGVENNVGMGTTNGWLTGIFGAPNIWALDQKTGKLTSTFETDQFKAAVSYARDLWSAGVMHPNALQYNLVSARNDFAARRFAFRFDGFQSASVTFWDNAPKMDPPGKPRIMAPFPAADGGKPTYWASTGILGYSLIKQAPPERIKEMLRILNWLASPMGSQEYLLMNYGLKDVHWTPDEKGNPILNGRGKGDALVPWRYITQGPVALYYTKDPQYGSIMQDAEKAMFPFISSNAVDGYYSPTSQSKSAGLLLDMSGKINDIVVGHQPFTAFDQAVREYLDGGGNQIRSEFEQQINK
jgi:putative aldouronate transport system substrate-binding protein